MSVLLLGWWAGKSFMASVRVSRFFLQTLRLCEGLLKQMCTRHRMKGSDVVLLLSARRVF